jgi:hypothetical protein
MLAPPDPYSARARRSGGRHRGRSTARRPGRHRRERGHRRRGHESSPAASSDCAAMARRSAPHTRLRVAGGDRGRMPWAWPVEEQSPTLVTGAEHFADRSSICRWRQPPSALRVLETSPVSWPSRAPQPPAARCCSPARRSAREVEGAAEATTPTAPDALPARCIERASLGWDNLTESECRWPGSSPKASPAGRRPAVRVPPHGRLAPRSSEARHQLPGGLAGRLRPERRHECVA